MSDYASKTTVPVERTRGEIEKLLKRFGAEEFLYYARSDSAVVSFVMNSRQLRFYLPLPDPSDRQFWYTPNKQRRNAKTATVAYEQAVRSRWRSLLLSIKAKITAIEDGISTFDDEFLAQTVLPGGVTVGEWALEQVDEAYRTNQMPPLLPGTKGARLALPGHERVV